jgi:GT2 family glycosyltransferase
MVNRFWSFLELIGTALRAPRSFLFARDPTTFLTRIMANHPVLTGSEKFMILALAGAADSVLAQFSLVVVIPFRDQWTLTLRCLDSIQQQESEGSGMKQLRAKHLVLVDNGSQSAEVVTGLQEVKKKFSQGGWDVTIQRDDSPFNFSTLNNKAVASFQSSSDLLLFLNNDVEFSAPSTLQTLVRRAASLYSAPECRFGAGGLTLLYPNRRIQHLFLAPGVKAVGAHPLRGQRFYSSNAWYSKTLRAVPAVTGACMIVRADIFHGVGGFEPLLATAYQDLDLCLKFQRRGLTNWVVPGAWAYHRESVSRAHLHKGNEMTLMYNRWGQFLELNPSYPEVLSRSSEYPLLRIKGWQYPWRFVAHSSVQTVESKSAN